MSSPIWPRLVRIILVLALGVSCFIAWGMPFANEDLFLALCSGRATLNGQLAAPDQWAFTLEETVWVDQSWLSHLLYYMSFHQLEYMGPVLIKGLLLLACAALLYLYCRSLDITPDISILSVTLGILCLAPFLKIRGENFGMFLFIVMTMLLTSPASWGRWRQLGALVILAVWSNSHGSFMLGFFLIGLRLGVDAVFSVRYALSQRSAHSKTGNRLPSQGDGRIESGAASVADSRPAFIHAGHDVVGWFVTTLLAVGIMAFLNPYGPENLVIPFKQIFAKTVTTQWIDWRPLFHWETFFRNGFFRPVSVLPFVLLMSVTVALLLCLAGMAGIRGAGSLLLSGSARSDRVMALLVPLLLAPLVFRFQRMILFAAPAMVPVVAMLIQGCFAAGTERLAASGKPYPGRHGGPVAAALSFVLLAAVSLVFYKSIVIRHLPDNPLTFLSSEQSLSSRLMSRNFMRSDAARFLRDNHIKGRVFTNVFLSSYLLFNVPDIRVYFDLRVQSVFPDEIVRGYLSVVARRSRDVDSILRLFDRFGIELVVLDTSKSANAWLADQLMQTMKWGCIYSDEWVIVLADVDSPRLGPIVKSGNLDPLRYDRPETKARSQALLSLFMKGSLEPGLLDRLIRMVKKHPRPEVYSLIISAMNGASPCLNTRTRRFLESEVARLSSANYLVAGGAFTVLKSLLRILVILERNEIMCVAQGRPQRFSGPRRRFTARFDEVKRRYGGF